MSQAKYRAEPLDPVVIDPYTIRHDHTVYTHLGCVLLRCAIGGAMIASHTLADKWPRVERTMFCMWIVLCLGVVIMFAARFAKYSAMDQIVWKVYLRTVVAYATAGTLIYNNKYEYAGLLVIVDALMGLQSRHMAFVSTYIKDMAQDKKTNSAQL